MFSFPFRCYIESAAIDCEIIVINIKWKFMVISLLSWHGSRLLFFYNPDRKKYNEPIAAQNLFWTSFFGRTNLADILKQVFVNVNKNRCFEWLKWNQFHRQRKSLFYSISLFVECFCLGEWVRQVRERKLFPSWQEGEGFYGREVFSEPPNRSVWAETRSKVENLIGRETINYFKRGFEASGLVCPNLIFE